MNSLLEAGRLSWAGGPLHMFVVPILTSVAWLSDGAAEVWLPAPQEPVVVRHPGDPRPRVGVRVGSKRVDAVVGLPGGHSTLGRLLAIRLGIEPFRRRQLDVAVIEELTLGDAVLRDLRVEVVDGDELVLGFGALPEVAVAVQASSGRLRVVRDGDADRLFASLGAPRGDGPAPFDTRLQRSRAPAEGSPTWREGLPVVYRAPRVEGRSLAPRWMEVGAEVWGADTTAELDVVVRPATGAWAVAVAERPAWLDPRPGELAALEVRAESFEPAPAAAEQSLPSGDPGVGWRASRWLELSRARWASGQLDGAAAAAAQAVGWGADRCEPWVVLGEQLLRGAEAPSATVRGVPAEPVVVLEHARRLLLAWTEQPPDNRGATFTVRQPSSCERVHGLLAEARLAAGLPVEGAHHDALVVAAVEALRGGRPAEAGARLRRARQRTPVADGRRDALQALADARAGRWLPARAALCPAHEVGLAEAVWLWEVARRVQQPVGCEAPSLAQQVVARLAGAEPHPLDVQGALARQPGDPSVEAAAWLAVELGWASGPVPTPRPSAHAVVAEGLLAQAATRPEGLAEALEVLTQHWPAWSPGNDPQGASVSYSGSPRQEESP